MVISKRAQIFLLAAIIISSVVISLGITANQARISHEPKNFYDFSYEVKQEIGAVMDYDIYTNFSEDDNLDEFVDILAENIKDTDPEANFIFIYGDENEITVKSYNSKKQTKSSIVSIGPFLKKTEESDKGKSIEKKINKDEMEGAGEVTVEIDGNEESFPISKYRQVIFLMQKDVGNESFITSK